MNLFVVSKGEKLYSVLTQIILKAIFAILRGIILPFSKDAFFFQVLIFPEGTCTNRSCLITFKQGKI